MPERRDALASTTPQATEKRTGVRHDTYADLMPAGYPRSQAAPPTLPHIEAQKARLDATAPRDPLAVDPAGRRLYRLRPTAPRGASDAIRNALDPEQLAAVESPPGRALVLAAAGSGKTRVIVHRLAHLAQTGTAPETMLLATFTRRGAREMTRRAANVAGVDLTGAWSGTFHAIAHRILRQYGTLVGLAPEFTILDSEDQADLVAVCRDEVLGSLESRPSLPSPANLANGFGLAAELGRDAAAYAIERNPRLVDRAEIIEQIAMRYAERKTAMGTVDYADLMVLVCRLMEEHPRASERLAAGFKAVLVDEFHDVNPLQARLAESLASVHGHLMVVGDPDQSIYGWRGADPEAVSRFAATPGTTVFPLQSNYRSTPEIVGLAQAMLPENNRYQRNLTAARTNAGAHPVVAFCASVEEEAGFVVQRIADLMNEGHEAGDIAVLYRAHHHSVDLQLALSAAGVEFELYSGARFVESAHIKDAVAFLRVHHNRRDEIAWRRALGLFDRIGPASVARAMAAIAGSDDAAAAIAAVPARGAGRTALTRAAAEIQTILAMDRPEAIVRHVAQSEWYRDRLERTYPNWRDREADLARLAELATRADGIEPFLSDLQLAERVEADEDISGPARRVSLSSVHQAKGLEWPVVFVLQVESGSFPSGWAVSEGNLDEEERLFYVAVTRAKDELYLCRPIAAKRPWDTGANRLVINSGQGFLDRNLEGLVEEWSIRGE